MVRSGCYDYMATILPEYSEANGNMVELIICNNDGMAEVLSLLCRALATTLATARPSPCSALTLPILPSSSSTRAR